MPSGPAMRCVFLRLIGLVLPACIVAAPAPAQDAPGLSSPAISRCAGRVGLDTRQSDAAFGIIALDGRPWLRVEPTDAAVGSQPIATTVTGTGLQRRRNGTSVPFRFTCVLDAQGQALMVHIAHLMPRLGDTLPPSIVVDGAATYREKMALPRGVELQVQLLDVSKSADGEVLAEQAVRSGWHVPIPFSLRLPRETSFEGRRVVVTARLVLARRVLFQLREPQLLAGAALGKPLELVLDKVE